MSLPGHRGVGLGIYFACLALRRSLRLTLHEWPHFNHADGRMRRWNSRRNCDGFVEIFGLDDVVAQELLACFGEGTIGHEPFAAAYPNTSRRRSRVQARTGHELSGRLDLLGEPHVFPHVL